ncbi:hypothetical protein ABIC65_001116 [Sphingomonas trueperi]|uniref:hypothetical protein n=1 Tax=Sphingomonas trueperi TaxID=53317 RepID=UPI003392141D
MTKDELIALAWCQSQACEILGVALKRDADMEAIKVLASDVAINLGMLIDDAHAHATTGD